LFGEITDLRLKERRAEVGSNALVPSRQREVDVQASAIEHLADRAVERTVAGRRAEYGAEMRRIVEATFELIERTGSLDPSMREILAETGLSTQAFYRYFSSKDELMLALLDDGRRRLVETLQRRMARSGDPSEQVRAWIEGALAQAANATAATRTRPWVLSEQRLAELFPEEQRASVELLVGLLVDPVERLQGPAKRRDADAVTAAAMIYQLTFAVLRAHLVGRTKPGNSEVNALVGFCLRGATP
jgi:AcrR family transcriptional regulator